MSKQGFMEVAGYIASLLIGLSLGLIGGGGSILTVPVLVYLFGVDPVIATAYSLFIVGSTSLVGAIPKYKQGFIDLKTALIFGAPSVIAVFATRKFLVPVIPNEVFHIGGYVVTKAILLMILFAFLMIAASVSMIRNKKNETPGHVSPVYNYPLLFLEGSVVGLLTGLVGAGGGFLIIPALVFFCKLPMKKAVGTSLLIIAAKSLIGFTGDMSNYSINWELMLTITAAAIAGIFLGNMLSNKITADKLKKVFGWFILIMGVYIIIKELFL